MKRVLIVGSGWLGIPLAKTLSEVFSVQCAYRSEQTKNRIKQNRLKPIGFPDDWSHFDIAVFCFPPKKDKESYSQSVQKYVNRLPQETKIILTSSIGIYPNISGRFKEDSIFQTPENKFYLKEAEDLVLKRKKSTVLRLGGLIGEDRHPIKFISGKPLKNPNGPINLVHRNDVIRVIQSCISKSWMGIFNVVAPINLTRFEYYSNKAKALSIAPPVSSEEPLINRKVVTKRLINEHGFVFGVSS